MSPLYDIASFNVSGCQIHAFMPPATPSVAVFGSRQLAAGPYAHLACVPLASGLGGGSASRPNVVLGNLRARRPSPPALLLVSHVAFASCRPLSLNPASDPFLFLLHASLVAGEVINDPSCWRSVCSLTGLVRNTSTPLSSAS